MTDCTLAKVDKSQMARMPREDHSAWELFVTHLLSRNVRYEADLVDQLFNSSENVWRGSCYCWLILGRIVGPKTVFPRIFQGNLAKRSRFVGRYDDVCTTSTRHSTCRFSIGYRVQESWVLTNRDVWFHPLPYS